MIDYLPIGTVIYLKGIEKRLMIYGRKQIHIETGREFDYIGCLYPEGYINDEYVLFFNSDQIEKVDYKGLSDQENIDFVSEYLCPDLNSAFK